MPSAGRHIQRRRFQFVFGKSSGPRRRPFSSRRTRYPFSTSRSALTLPPKPDPMTMKSHSMKRRFLRIEDEKFTVVLPTEKIGGDQGARTVYCGCDRIRTSRVPPDPGREESHALASSRDLARTL